MNHKSNSLGKHQDRSSVDSVTPIGSPMSAQAVLEREYLEMRALILQLGASFDRIQRSPGPAADPQKMQQLQAGVRLLLNADRQVPNDRQQSADSSDTGQSQAERIQRLFSNDYRSDWPQVFGIDHPILKS